MNLTQINLSHLSTNINFQNTMKKKSIEVIRMDLLWKIMELQTNLNIINSKKFFRD